MGNKKRERQPQEATEAQTDGKKDEKIDRDSQDGKKDGKIDEDGDSGHPSSDQTDKSDTDKSDTDKDGQHPSTDQDGHAGHPGHPGDDPLVQLKTVTAQRDQIQSNYDTLMSKLISMKSLFTNMKQTEVELEQAKEQIKELEKAREKVAGLENELKVAKTHHLEATSECERLSASLNTCTKQYEATVDELQNEKYALENENAKLSRRCNEYKVEIGELELMQNEIEYEKKSLEFKVGEMNERLEEEMRVGREKDGEIERLRRSVEDLEKEVQNVRASRDVEIAKLSEQVEKNRADSEAQEAIRKAQGEKIEELEGELKQIDHLKQDIHNKSLQIGKLRQEAIILNDHLTKSMSLLKQNTNRNTIDKELISNVLISFLQMPRGDTKKFESLQLISGLLEWSNEQKVSAGLAGEEKKTEKQSFAGLWMEYLERESSK